MYTLHMWQPCIMVGGGSLFHYSLSQVVLFQVLVYGTWEIPTPFSYSDWTASYRYCIYGFQMLTGSSMHIQTYMMLN